MSKKWKQTIKRRFNLEEYKDDKKEGYGIFKWVDGKKYRGYWINGKQNGEGEFYNNSTKQWKKCLVQNGKKIKWLN